MRLCTSVYICLFVIYMYISVIAYVLVFMYMYECVDICMLGLVVSFMRNHTLFYRKEWRSS